jgi:hypothetical protein
VAWISRLPSLKIPPAESNLGVRVDIQAPGVDDQTGELIQKDLPFEE